MTRLILAFALLPTVALAECPPAPDHSDALDALFDAARAAPNEGAARGLTGEMWTLWADAPDEPAQALLTRGISALQVSNFIEAFDAFDRLIDYCPDYAEGWNQRAFAHFLSGDYEAALPDLLRADELNPKHTGVLTGVALTLIALDREDEAQPWLKRAVALNPWISERRLLKEPAGTDL